MDSKSLLSGMAMGAALAFTLDPSRGGRRRALIRDRVIRCSRECYAAAEGALSDLANRAQGLVARTIGHFQSDEIDDARLVERVRAKLGWASSHPRAIEVTARDGEVSLRGAILADEVSDVLAATASVRGVQAVVNALEPHDSADGVPSLQGGRIGGPALDLIQEHWAPATGALVGLAALAASGLAVAAYARK